MKFTIEHLYMALAVLGALVIFYFILRKAARKNTNTHSLLSEYTHLHNKNNRELDKMDKKARKIVGEFMAWMHVDSPYNRRQRRLIKRHYVKFVMNWFNIPKKDRDVDKIIHYLVHLGPHNNHVVKQYLGYFLGLRLEEKHNESKTHN